MKIDVSNPEVLNQILKDYANEIVRRSLDSMGVLDGEVDKLFNEQHDTIVEVVRQLNYEIARVAKEETQATHLAIQFTYPNIKAILEKFSILSTHGLVDILNRYYPDNESAVFVAPFDGSVASRWAHMSTQQFMRDYAYIDSNVVTTGRATFPFREVRKL